MQTTKHFELIDTSTDHRVSHNGYFCFAMVAVDGSGKATLVHRVTPFLADAARAQVERLNRHAA